MFGVILCGGFSSRMGTDKGLLQSNTIHWAKNAANKMALLNIPVGLSVNANQLSEYSSLFHSSYLIEDKVSLKIRGPLSGVLSAHLQHPQEDLFVLAVDMPVMDISILQQLLQLYRLQPSNDAFVFTKDGQVEPLCGIYTAKGLAHILHLHQTNLLRKHSMKFVLEHLETSRTPLNEEQKIYFKNINTHAELNGL